MEEQKGDTIVSNLGSVGGGQGWAEHTCNHDHRSFLFLKYDDENDGYECDVRTTFFCVTLVVLWW